MISFCLINCEKEPKDDLTSSPKSRYEVRTLTNQELRTNVSVSNKLEKLEKKKINGSPSDGQSREIYNADLGFTIDTHFVVYVEDTETGNHSYSFPITRDAPEDDQVENLLLQSDMGGGYDAYIVKYGFTEEDYPTLGEPTINQYGTSFLSVDFDTSVFNPGELSRTSYECNETWNLVSTTEHNGNLHGANTDGSCPVRGCLFGTSRWVMSLSCDFYYDGGPNPDGGIINPSGGGGDSSSGGNTNNEPPHNDSGNSPPIITSPAIDNTFISPNDQKNCNELNKLTSNPPPNTTNPYTIDGSASDPTGKNTNIRAAITNIDDELGNNFENGFGFYNKGDYPTYGPYAHYVPASEDNHVHFPTWGFQFGTVHTHPNDGVRIPMFSHDDIYTLLHIKNNYVPNTGTNGDALFVSVLMVKQGGQTHTYAIKIEDIIKLQGLDGIHQNDRNWEKYGEKLSKKYTDNADGVDGSPNQYQKTFLNFVKDKNLGVSLYEMDQTNAGTANVNETWSKLTLNSTSPNGIKKSQCN